MFEIIGPSDAAINALVRSYEKLADEEAKQILIKTAKGSVTVISQAYNILIYGTPPGVFGRPKDDGKPLAQAVQSEATDTGARVFTTKPEAAYLEFGTGIYNTMGARKPIRPKKAKRLAFPFWTLPQDFKGYAIYRKDVKGPLPPGAKGLVLAREVDGVKARPVWFSPLTIKAIERILEVEIKRGFK